MLPVISVAEAPTAPAFVHSASASRARTPKVASPPWPAEMPQGRRGGAEQLDASSRPAGRLRKVQAREPEPEASAPLWPCAGATQARQSRPSGARRRSRAESRSAGETSGGRGTASPRRNPLGCPGRRRPRRSAGRGTHAGAVRRAARAERTQRRVDGADSRPARNRSRGWPPRVRPPRCAVCAEGRRWS